jgi:hypothetical protein
MYASFPIQPDPSNYKWYFNLSRIAFRVPEFIEQIPKTIIGISLIILLIGCLPIIYIALLIVVIGINQATSKIYKMKKIIVNNPGIIPYEAAMRLYVDGKSVIKMYEQLPSHKSFITRILYRKLTKFNNEMIILQSSLETQLFIDTSKQPKLTPQEKETFAWLNDVWGDDDDEVYAKNTYFHNTKNLAS